MPKESKKKRITPVIEELVTSSDQEQSPPPSHVDSEPVAPPHQPDLAPEEPIAQMPKEGTKIGFGFFVVMIIVAMFVALLTGGLYVYFNGVASFSGASPTPVPQATPVPTEEQTPLPSSSAKPTATPKIADYKISVLNGSGKIGEAGKIKSMLEKAGFKVTQTGNANTFDYTDTVVQAKGTIPAEVIVKLKDTLKAAYSLKDGDPLDAKNSFDIIVTVGTK